jgi:hypothetical protein
MNKVEWERPQRRQREQKSSAHKHGFLAIFYLHSWINLTVDTAAAEIAAANLAAEDPIPSCGICETINA